MARIKYVKVAELKVGKFRLVEKDAFQGDEYVDTICEVRQDRSAGYGVYCNINDALAHKCEWFEG